MLVGKVVFQQEKSKEDQNAAIRAAMMSRNNPDAPVPVQHSKPDKEEIARKPYQFLLVNVLREYLAFEMRSQLPFPWDPERVYDDFGGSMPLNFTHSTTLNLLRSQTTWT